MDKKMLKQKITEILEDESNLGIELYLCIKEDCNHGLRRIKIDEVTGKEFTHAFAELLRTKYTNEELEIKPLHDMSDNQKALYFLTQADGYCPFAFLKNTSVPEYDSDQKLTFIGYVIKLGNYDNHIFLFQQRNNTMSLNNDRTFLLRKVKNVFSRVDEEVMRIEKRIDVIILGDEILGDNMKALEKHFGLEAVIRKEANQTIQKISALNLIRSNELLVKYERQISRSRKLMKLKDSPVFEMTKEQIIERIGIIERYNNSIKIIDNEIVVEKISDIENVIKMLGDAILRSPLTDAEYETMVKTKLDSLEP